MSPIAITLFIFTLQINQVLGPAEFLGQFNDCAPTDRKPFCVCKLTQAQKDRGGGKGVFRIPYASQVKTATRAEA